MIRVTDKRPGKPASYLLFNASHPLSVTTGGNGVLMELIDVSIELLPSCSNTGSRFMPDEYQH